ncbi:exodeoxyribonuclease III [Myxococcota bacterium]|nr:exodeoxyribonuclease III [Myxococcota bacterium]
MKIATWNINGLRARLEFVLAWLADRKPDVVGLQELKLTDDKFPHDALAEAGYQAVAHGQKSWNGVAVLVPLESEIEATQVGLPGQDDFGARLLTARLPDLTFTTVYCPNGKNLEHDDYPRKLAWFDSLIEHLKAQHTPDEPLVLCGDFNICPTPLDSWNEEAMKGDIFHTDAERTRIRSLLDWGLTDLHRHLHPDAADFSWWDYRGGAFHKKQGLRIDFLLATQPLVARTRTAGVDRDWRKKVDGMTASDHAPVVAELD